MNFRFHILASSSAGNCGLLVTPNARILIDAGISATRIRRALAAVGEKLEDIDAVFITHEHSDHCKGVAALSKLERPVFFANEGTARAVQNAPDCLRCAAEPRWNIFETGSTFGFRGFRVSPFSIPHDAADPVGYVFSEESGDSPQTFAWATDLGYVPQLVREKIKNADCLVLESNYDPAMLERSGRPLQLKQRIRGRHGHLSNDDALELLISLENTCLRHVFLAHLSKECNSPRLVEDSLAMVKTTHPQCLFTVVPPDSDTPFGT
ncbi:MAG: MBL fold metallo-hydrolase [Puniceicoccales bacterium]|nr:MBL fold metallo-hydrolase [Puniceicoccales bacterium]